VGRRALAGAGAALLLAGCGSSPGDAPKRVALDFYAALSAHDGARACALLAPRARGFVASSGRAPCAQAIFGRVRFALGGHPTVTFLVMEGDGATVEMKLAAKGPTAKLALQKLGGRWQVVAFA